MNERDFSDELQFWADVGTSVIKIAPQLSFGTPPTGKEDSKREVPGHSMYDVEIVVDSSDFSLGQLLLNPVINSIHLQMLVAVVAMKSKMKPSAETPNWQKTRLFSQFNALCKDIVAESQLAEFDSFFLVKARQRGLLGRLPLRGAHEWDASVDADFAVLDDNLGLFSLEVKKICCAVHNNTDRYSLPAVFLSSMIIYPSLPSS